MANEHEGMPGPDELQQGIGAGDAEALRRAILVPSERELQATCVGAEAIDSLKP